MNSRSYNFQEEVHKHPFKFLKATYIAINNFSKTRTFVVHEPKNKPISNATFKIKRSKKSSFIFEAEIKKLVSFNDFTFSHVGFDPSFTLQSKSEKFYMGPKAVTSIHAKLGSPKLLTGEISNYSSNQIEHFNKKFLRLIIPVNEKVFTTDIKGTSYTDKVSIYYGGLITVEIKNNCYNFYRHEHRKKHYLIVECLKREEFTTFEATSNSIIKAFSLLEGNWYGGQRFIVSSESEMFDTIDSVYYDKESDSILTNHKIINPLQFVEYMKAHGENLDIYDNLFPDTILGIASVKIIDEEEINRALSLILEGNLALSPILKSCSYLVAIETLAGAISKRNKEFFKLVKNNNNATDLTTRFLSIVDEFKGKLSEKELEVLKKKIEFFNSPSNLDKILKSFEFYNINLPEHLLKLLKTRNLFLHGKTPFNEKIVRERMYELMLNSLRFQMMACMLFLKYCGYKGHIKNLAAYRILLR